MSTKHTIRLFAIAVGLSQALHAVDGVLDATFHFDGKRTVHFDDHSATALDNDTGRTVAMFGDGRIVAAGSASYEPGDTDFAFTVLQPDGEFDTGFSGDGRRAFGIDLGEFTKIDEVGAVATMPDGRIVACGRASSDDAHRLVVVRLTATGTLDTTFGAEGQPTGDGEVVLAPFDDPDSINATCRALVVHADGKIVVPFSNSNELQGGLIRLEADGDLDPTFGGDGISDLLQPLVDSDTLTITHALALPDGKYLAAGLDYSGKINDNRTIVARYTSTGLLDSSFSGDGQNVYGDVDVQLTSMTPEDVALDPRGRPVLLTRSFVPGGAEVYSLVRLTAGGTIDTGFAFSGWVRLVLASPTPDLQVLTGLLVQGDGKIVVGGYFLYEGDSGARDCGAMRLVSTGTALDSSFGSGGVAAIPFDLGDVDEDLCRELGSGDGRPVLVGSAKVGDDYDIALARLTNAYIFHDGFESDSLFFWSTSAP